MPVDDTSTETGVIDDAGPTGVAGCCCTGCCVYQMGTPLTFTWSGLPVFSPCNFDLNGTWPGTMNEAGTVAYQTAYPDPVALPRVLCQTNPDRYRYPAGTYCNNFGFGPFADANVTCVNGVDTPYIGYSIQRNTFGDCDDPCLYTGRNEFYSVAVYGADKVLEKYRDGPCCVYRLKYTVAFSLITYTCNGTYTYISESPEYSYGECELRVCPGTYGYGAGAEDDTEEGMMALPPLLEEVEL